MNESKSKTDEKTQFNVRIPRALKSNTVTVAARLGLSQEDMAQMGLKLLFGIADKLTLKKTKMARAMAKELHLSFNDPEHQMAGFSE